MNKIHFTLGIFILMSAWIGPIPKLAHHTFFGHMIMHMMVVAIAPAFLSLPIENKSISFFNKYPHLFNPLIASVGEFIIVWFWHAPGPHHFARNDSWGFFWEQFLFLLSGLWVWISSMHDQRRGAGILALLLTSMHMTLLGALLGLSPRPLYSHHHANLSLNSLQDQQLGGAIMIVIGGIFYLWGGLYLSLQLLSEKNSPGSI